MPTGYDGREARPYRKYRPLPALILITVLGVASAVIWVRVLNQSGDVNDAIRCDPPASAPPGMTYTSLPHDALDHLAPVPPEQVKVTVLNAGGKRGQATLVSESLEQLGFTNQGEPANDKAYENRDKPPCRGQIRFGPKGEAAARTLSLVDSCVEFIKDERKNASVDLAVGEDFTDVLPRREAVTVLNALAKWSSKHGKSSELDAADGLQMSEELLEAARHDNC